jgi:hypothetical protein
MAAIPSNLEGGSTMSTTKVRIGIALDDRDAAGDHHEGPEADMVITSQRCASILSISDFQEPLKSPNTPQPQRLLNIAKLISKARGR